jgi:tyrosinase
MGDPNRAARDPIFWLHHANVDRLWKRWLQQGGGRADPTGNAAWMKTVFRFFDENSKEVKMTGADILNTVTQLQYRYDDDPVILAPAAAVAAAAAPKVKEVKAMQTVATAEKTGVALGDRPVTVTVALKAPAKAAIKRLTGAAAADAPAHAVILRLEDVTFDKQPGIYYEVYLNLPAKEEPDFQNGRYVGNLGLFAKPHAGGKDDHKMADVARISADFDVSGVVRELAQAKKWDADQLTVTFVPRGLEDSKGRPQKVKTEAKIKVGKITLNSPKE